jgi:hypothetical protein
MSNCENVEIGQTIDEHVLERMQIIIHDENEKHFQVQTPFNEDFVDLFNSLNGYFVTETKLWCFETASNSCDSILFALPSIQIFIVNFLVLNLI